MSSSFLAVGSAVGFCGWVRCLFDCFALFVCLALGWRLRSLFVWLVCLLCLLVGLVVLFCLCVPLVALFAITVFGFVFVVCFV